MKRCQRLVVLALSLVPLADAYSQAPKHPLSVDDLWKVQRLGKPALAPDGKRVAVEVTTYAMEDNDSTSAIWLLSTDGKTRRRLTTSKGKNSGPVWSPDSKTIAFVSKRSGDVSQIHLIAADGGEARQLTRLPMGPSGLKWGPDGKTIYCIVHTWLDTPDDASFKKRENARKDDKVRAVIVDDAMYRYWDAWLADGKRPVLFAVDVESGKHKNLFAGLKRFLPVTDASADSYDISPDGKELCFTADTVEDIGTDFNLDLYTMPLDRPGQPTNITTDNPAGDFNPLYSPDGSYIAFLRQTTKFFYADRVRIMAYKRDENSVWDEITTGFNRSCSSPQWRPGPRGLIFEAEDKGYHRLFAAPLPDRRGIQELTRGWSDTSPRLSQDGHTLVFLRANFDTPPQLFVKTPKSEKPVRLDQFNDDLVAGWDLEPVKEIYYKGADNEDVQMWIAYPPQFDPTKKWPLLMVVHGGPHNAIPTDFHFRWNLQLFAAQGYVVACPNFHGSSGFGQDFTDSITGDMATKPFLDIMKATDYMERLSYIDKDRMVAAGASYGGYMMSWLNGHTDRFKALVCHAGVYNWHSMMASDIVRGRQRALGALPWGDLHQIDKQSPQRFAANFKTPTLVMHGEKDFRVPVTQGFEYYNTLRMKGVPARLVYFPDENHWVLKPQNARLWTQEFFAWLEKYVGGKKE
jgi:dipeptidyl aminopeptidase/acylaminoacyl peptidase